MNERFLDEIGFKRQKVVPAAAEGKFCIDLTDPITGKVKERIDGKNHVFLDALLCCGGSWINLVSTLITCMNTNNADIDTTLPYMLGDTVGWGIPSTAGSGTQQGAYNATNQVLAALTYEKARWKFQYDFTSAQANNVSIGCIGLTNQYTKNASCYSHLNDFRMPNSSGQKGYLSDGRYSYSCSSAGIITKYDIYNGTSANIDVSAIVGTVSGNSKGMGYNPVTGKYYIFVGSSTAASRKMYVFSDSTFATLENTYSPSNNTITGMGGFFVYGTVATWGGAVNNTLYRADFSSNSTLTTITVSTYNAYMGSGVSYPANGMCPIKGSLVAFGAGDNSNVKTILYELSTESVAGFAAGVTQSGSGSAVCKLPYVSENILTGTNTSNGTYNSTRVAVAMQKLPAPVTKTTSYGLTATYELEVYWG